MKRFGLQDRFQFGLRTVRKVGWALKVSTFYLKHTLSHSHILSQI
jgi:hypothetical protein